MRHGESFSNREGVIISEPSVGTVSYGLTEIGREQAANNAATNRACFSDPRRLLVLSSDFLRAKETAEIAHQVLECLAPIEFSVNLRERGFGPFHGVRVADYESEWRQMLQRGEFPEGVETVDSVYARTYSLVEVLESRFEGREILLVSHGDPIQILHCGVNGCDIRKHRDGRYIANGEIRALCSQ